jgi:hypothetical protein
VTGAEAQARQVRAPGRLIGKGPALVAEQGGDDRLSHAVLEHGGGRGGIQHVLGMAGAEKGEDVQPALRRPRGEPGEAVVAHMGGVLVAPGMTGRRVVDRHPARGRQPSLQEGVLLGVEDVLARGEQGEDLALGDTNAQGGQLSPQALGRDLPLDMLHQDVAHHARAEVAGHPRRQRSRPSGVRQRCRR